MLDADLAALYGVTTKAFNQAVRRNRDRFPEGFVFQLTAKEKQEVVTNCDHLDRLRFSRTRPYAFTEHGAIMLASVLRTRRAVEVSVFVVKAFVRMRRMLGDHRKLALKVAELEETVAKHGKDIAAIVKAIRQLLQPPGKPKGRIGFWPVAGLSL